MTLELIKLEVGPWPMNAYILLCEETGTCAVIDPGADADKILDAVNEYKVARILVTHGHYDHVDAVPDVAKATGAPVCIHPADAEKFDVSYDIPLADGDIIPIGNGQVRAIHTPGHTPGLTCFDLGDNRIVVGDTVFVGGPGATRTPENFSQSMETMQRTVFAWPDETEFFPGHGPSGTIGGERPAFGAFVAQGWSEDLCGDVTWT
jgi:glyoxylase-like metal-dependent hydrolase (beta-lactamase superfamily II)